MVINEQIRRYNEKMEEIEQLEYAEALAVNQLKLKRQNTVRCETLVTRRHYLSTVAKNIYFIVLQNCAVMKRRKKNHILNDFLLVSDVCNIMNWAHGVAPLFLDDIGNMADVPCLSLALLAFTSQVLSSLQRSGGMYHWVLPVQ